MLRIISTTTLLLFLAFSAAAQDSKKERQVFLDQINAVFGDDYFQDRPEMRERYVEVLRDRIAIVEKGGVDVSQYTLLSTVGTNRYSLLPRNPYGVFDPATFNPLIYELSFFGWGQSAVYRVDGTDYYIVIQPQSRLK